MTNSLTEHVANIERSLKYRKTHKKISTTVLSELREHSETRKMNESPHLKELLNYVSLKTNCSSILKSNIYSITNNAVSDTEKFCSKKAIEAIDILEREIYLEAPKMYLSCMAFYYLDTKEIFYITDIYHKKGMEFLLERPKRFSEKEWKFLRVRATLVHELYHMHMDIKSNCRNEMQQERYAYSGMIDWCRQYGNLTDTEIATHIINTYGERLICLENPKLNSFFQEDLKLIKKRGIEEGLKLISENDVLKDQKTVRANDDEDDCECFFGIEI